LGHLLSVTSIFLRVVEIRIARGTDSHYVLSAADLGRHGRDSVNSPSSLG
jgi:hypothetical protein